MATSAQASQVVGDFFEAMAARDGDRIAVLLAEDVTWSFPGDLPFSGRHAGKEAVLTDVLAASAPYFEPGHLRIEMRNLISDGGLVVAEYTGRNLTVTGRSYENRYVFVVAVADGVIRSIRTYFDTAYMEDVVASG